MTIDYKYNEGATLAELQSYIDKTYGQHYSQNKYQATEFIIDSGHGTGFCIGNVLKYAQRYGRKGDPAAWRSDLLKVIHYAIIQLHIHDQEQATKTPATPVTSSKPEILMEVSVQPILDESGFGSGAGVDLRDEKHQ